MKSRAITISVIEGRGSMPYYVSWVKEGRVRRFAYPHTDLKTALGFAGEVIRTELDCSDVWVSDETGHKVADKDAVAEYAEAEEEYEDGDGEN